MATIKVVLDKRRLCKGNVYPLQLRVIHQRKTKNYNLSIYLKENEWDERASLVKDKHPRSNEYNHKISVELGKAYSSIAELGSKPYSLKDFDLRFTSTSEYSLLTFKGCAEEIIKSVVETNRIGTADWYKTAVNSFFSYVNEDVELTEISRGLISNYINSLLKFGVRKNTVNSYIRAIRAIYNKSLDLYPNDVFQAPFRGLKLPKEETVKRSLTVEQLKRIKSFKTDCNKTSRARDLFILSFYLVGINFSDLACLKKTDFKEGRIIYKRMKTGKLFSVKVLKEAKQIIEKWEGRGPFLLNLLEEEIEDMQKSRDVRKDKLKQLNKYLKRLGRELDLDLTLTSYVSRHSWATTAKRLKIPNEVIAECMGHSYGNSTTEIYLAGFDLEELDKANSKVTNTLLKDHIDAEV